MDEAERLTEGGKKYSSKLFSTSRLESRLEMAYAHSVETMPTEHPTRLELEREFKSRVPAPRYTCLFNAHYTSSRGQTPNSMGEWESLTWECSPAEEKRDKAIGQIANKHRRLASKSRPKSLPSNEKLVHKTREFVARSDLLRRSVAHFIEVFKERVEKFR